MSPNPSADDPAASFACHWRLEGREAASVRVSGELDLATAPRLERTLREALGMARLVLLDLHEMSFMDSTGLRVLLDTSVRGRVQGASVVLAGASAQVERLLDVTGVRAQLDLLDVTPHPEGGSPRVKPVDGNGSTPFDNPANDRVLTARVMAVSDVRLWMLATNGTIYRPWAPAADGLRAPTGSEVELYLDAGGAVNGWYEPRSGLAINQRCLSPGESPATHSDLACAGPCGIVWLAPAGTRLRERDERCLTCAGPLVLH